MGFTTAYANSILSSLFKDTSIALSTTTPTAAVPEGAADESEEQNN